ncbi:Alpha-L-arabinofuranosidase C [Halioglobus japonicus]|nr:Alpha-L-arabinofuranosidase C [Halioglobus japonicus]
MTTHQFYRAVLLSAALLISSGAYAADCAFTVSNEWGSGFTSTVTITNDSNQAIDSWEVLLHFSDDTQITGMWNANLSGNSPYSARSKSYNSTIAPNSSTTFGFNSQKSVLNAPATRPELAGICSGSANTAPNASASADPQRGEIPLQVDFDASGSSDPEHDTLSYVWDFGDGSSSTEVAPSHTYTQAGNYTATLTVNDGELSSDTRDLLITALSVEPAGVDCEVTIHYEWNTGFTTGVRLINTSNVGITDWSVTLDYSGASSIATIWNAKLSGNGPYTASNHSNNATIAPNSSVVFLFNSRKAATGSPASIPTLGGLCTGSNTNNAPIAHVSATPLEGTAPLSVDFTGVNSSDPDGDRLVYAWSFGDGETATGESVSHTYSKAGVYSATLKVTDPGYASDSTSIDITVNQAAPPVADCQYSISDEWDHGFTTAIRVTNTSELPIVGGWAISFDFGGTAVITHAWNTDISGNAPYIATNKDYNATIAANSTIDIGFNANKTSAYTAAQPPVLGGLCEGSTINRPPNATASAAPDSGAAPLSVTFVGTASTDPDGDTLIYHWDFGDGSSSTEASPVHVYNDVGSYTATLTVTDTQGRADTSQLTVTATDPWVLDSEASSLHFVSTKKVDVIETHTFTDISGSISAEGNAEILLKLDSVETGIEVRNTRMRDFLFETAGFSHAAIALDVDMSQIEAIAVGSALDRIITPTVNLHSAAVVLDIPVRITRVSPQLLLIENTSPILVNAADFELVDGIEVLRDLAGLSVISYTVPTNFMLLFRAQ